MPAPATQLIRFAEALVRIAERFEGVQEGDLTAREREIVEVLASEGFLVRDQQSGRLRMP